MTPGIFYFITDTHFRATSNVRIGDYRTQLLDKLDYVIAEANREDATILLGGDIFDTPSVDYETFMLVWFAFKKAKYTPYAIDGNHDLLYASRKLFQRTCINALNRLGAIRLLTEPVEIETPNLKFVLTPKAPSPLGVPQITVFHGFLNQDDGIYTFNYQDIMTDDNCLVLLGHDHTPYEDVQYRNTTIIRPGSFVRGVRQDSNMRIPVVVRIETTPTGFSHTYFDIKAAVPIELAFKPKPRTLSSRDIGEMLDGLDTTRDAESFDDLLKKHAQPHVVEYINQLLNLNKL